MRRPKVYQRSIGFPKSDGDPEKIQEIALRGLWAGLSSQLFDDLRQIGPSRIEIQTWTSDTQAVVRLIISSERKPRQSVVNKLIKRIALTLGLI